MTLPETFPDIPNVDPTIHPAEKMWPEHRAHYFAVGQSALRAIRLALQLAHRPDPAAILDLPCGHGRVTRTLRAAYPAARITACDLLADGVEFCAQTFAADPVISVDKPTPALFPYQFDLIFVGSLLTHLDAPYWQHFLALFSDLLLPGGVLVFTTHGHEVATRLRAGNHYGYLTRGLERRLRRYTRYLRGATEAHDDLARTRRLLARFDRTGFAFTGPGYGLTLSSPAWVTAQLAHHPALQLIMLKEKLWDEHQDVVACCRL